MSRTFGAAATRVPALDRVSPELERRAILCAVGPKGCGKFMRILD